MKSFPGFMPSDISGTIELDLAKEHNLIIQSMASPTGQLIHFPAPYRYKDIPAIR